MKTTILFFLSLLVFSACGKKGKNNPNACNGNTRRDVKVMVDDLASAVDTSAIVTTIKAMGEITVSKVDKNTTRLDLEKYTYTVTGAIDKIKRYRDGDYHIRLVDENENYIITEAPNPGCEYAQNSVYHSVFKSNVAFIEANDFQEGDVLTITGVAFVDLDHGYKRKQAKNNLELHPILKIEK